MPTVYIIEGMTVDALRQSLNFSLQNIADRLDKLEGIRGSASMEGNLDMNDKKIVNAGLDDDSAGSIIGGRVFDNG